MIEMAQERPKESGSSGGSTKRVHQTNNLPPPRQTSFFEQLFGTRTSQQQTRPPSRVR
jgi:hypothetical protein